MTMLALASVLTISVLNNNSFSAIVSAFACENHQNCEEHTNGGPNQIPTVVTVPLEGLSLDPAQFLLLSDTTPLRVGAAHIAINVPCDVNGVSNIAVIAGVAPDVNPVELELVPELTFSLGNCLFHGDIPNNSDEVTDIAIVNTGGEGETEEQITFNSGNFATLSISEVRN